MSAQLASIYCMAIECKVNKVGGPLPFFGTPIRFRDNFLTILLDHLSTSELLLHLSQTYDLEFTKEQAALTAVCLETVIHWKQWKGKFLGFTLAWKSCAPEAESSRRLEVLRVLRHRTDGIRPSQSKAQSKAWV